MDDFFGLLPFFLILLLSMLSGGKKKKSKQPRQTRRRAADKGWKTAFEQADDLSEEDCSEQPIHLHSVSQAAMQAAGEGEDPCHRGGVHAGGAEAMEEASLWADDQPQEDAQRALAQDVLRGVIMSEILTRPCERAASNRRRGIHG